ncbi:MAG: GumC family protein [Terriglobia bacterium]
MEEQEIELIDYLRVIWKRKRLIVGGTLLAAVTALPLSLSIPKTYEASVTLLVTESKIPSVEGSGPMKSGPSSETVEGMIRNTSLAEEAIQKFGLDREKYKLTAQGLLDSVVSIKLKRNTSLIVLTISFPDALLARDIANFLAEQAVELNAQLNRGDTVKAREYIKGQQDDVRVKMEHAQTELVRFRREAHLAALRKEVEVLLAQKSDLKRKYVDALTSIEGNRAELKELSEQINMHQKVETIVKSIEKEPVFLFAPIENNQTPLLGLQMKSEEFNPVYRNTEQALIQTRGRLASLEAQRDDLGHRLPETEKMLAEAEMQLATKEARLEELTTNYTLARDAYLLFARKFAEASLWVASRGNELKIVDPAVAPRDLVKPRVRLIVAVAGMLGLMGSILLAFFLEYVEKAKGRDSAVRSEG